MLLRTHLHIINFLKKNNTNKSFPPDERLMNANITEEPVRELPGSAQTKLILRDDPDNTWKERDTGTLPGASYHVIKVENEGMINAYLCQHTDSCYFCVGYIHGRPLEEIYRVRHSWGLFKESVFGYWENGCDAWGIPVGCTIKKAVGT